MKQAIAGLMLACALLASGLVRAADETSPRSYAVLSLVGDSLSISPYMENTPSGVSILSGGSSGASVSTRGMGGWESQGVTTGSRLNQEPMLVTPVKETTFDDAAVNGIAGAIREREPAAAVELLSGRNTGWYGLQDRLFDAPGAAKDAREALKATLKARKASYLIVVTKRRSRMELLADARVFAAAQLRLLSGSSNDTKKLEGIGFYVDDTVRVQDLNTLDRSTGVLASFVNVTVRLVDARTLEVMRELITTRSKIIAISKPLEAGFSAWDEATEAQKLESLQGLVRASMKDAIPNLLNKAP